jgi:iron complex transport system substrate-binding protein
VTAPTAAPRIVSLLPATTEIVHRIGLLDHLVGRSHACDHPPEVAAIPAVTSTRIDPSRPSAEIDRDVRTLVEQALSPFKVDADALKALAPDVILTQHQCEVCAISEKDLAAAVKEWTGSAPRIVSIAPARLSALYRGIEKIGEMFDHRYEGEALARYMRERIEVIAERAGSISPRPKVLALDWLDPPMAAGLWVPELIRAAGGRPVLATIGVKAPVIDIEAIVGAAPNVIVLMPCGFHLARTTAESEAFLATDGIAELVAAGRTRVVAADGNAYFNRPGPRLVESVETLAEIIEPGAFNFSHEGTGWAPLIGRGGS